MFGQILLAVIAIAVTVFSGGGFAAALGSKLLGFAAAAAYGTAVSQVYGNILGIQKGFDFKQIALSALTAGIGQGVSAGLNAIAKTASAAAAAAGTVSKLATFIGSTGGKIVGAVVGSAITQGIATATGLQDKFSWAGVAAAGVGAGVGGLIGGKLPSLQTTNTVSNHLNHLGVSMARALANAATRSIIEGTDFGDNIIAALPDTIAQTVGDAFEFGVTRDPAKPFDLLSQLPNGIGGGSAGVGGPEDDSIADAPWQ
ncbi:MAG: hypothetical protein RL367_140, partial [Pseudomonadota bacterium]